MVTRLQTAISPVSMFTLYGYLLCAWIVIGSFQYGYHISVLNQIHTALTCSDNKRCIPMSDETFSAVTAVFTLGGLAGSLVANIFMDRYGRKPASTISAVFVAVGSVLMVGSSVALLAFGRFLVGVGSGIAICVVPIFLAEISPPKVAGTVGVLTQLGIVFGIFVTQLIGLAFATPDSWRLVLFFSLLLAIAQCLLSPFVTDSPAYVATHVSDGREAASKVQRRIWGDSKDGKFISFPNTTFLSYSTDHTGSTTSSIFESERDDAEHVRHPLLDGAEPSSHLPPSDGGAISNSASISLLTILRSPPRDLRVPMTIVCSAMIGQQVSGINAVLYYSNDILSNTLPTLGPYVSLAITIVNMIMTFPPIFLIERMGRRQLLTLSTVGAILSLISVGIGLNMSWPIITSIGIIAFVMSFAVGLGPVPFVMISEVSPFYAVSALSSLALSMNWIANFLVGLAFLPLRNLLSGNDPSKEGRVFWVFALLLAAAMSVVRTTYRR